MEALSSAIVAFAAFASVGFAISGSLTAGAAGLVVTNAIMVTGLLAGGVQTATQLEVEMNAVERIRGVSEEATPEVQTLRLMGGSFEDDATRVRRRRRSRKVHAVPTSGNCPQRRWTGREAEHSRASFSLPHVLMNVYGI